MAMEFVVASRASRATTILVRFVRLARATRAMVGAHGFQAVLTGAVFVDPARDANVARGAATPAVSPRLVLVLDLVRARRLGAAIGLAERG